MKRALFLHIWPSKGIAVMRVPGFLIVCFTIAGMALFPAPASPETPLPVAGGISEVVAVGPSWDSFTNKDGTGLYHEILNKVFGLYGITVRREYVPSERGLQLIANGEADFHTCYDKVAPPFVLARIPMYENTFSVFFHKERIGPWKGLETLRGRTVACRIGYYTEDNFDVPVLLHPVKTGGAALGMVVLGRMDFYVDDRKLIEESMRDAPVEFDLTEYDIREAGRRAYFPVFADSERGAGILELYEAGMRRLHETGELKPIFEKWGHPYPQYDAYMTP